jgi:hypothetical protein
VREKGIGGRDEERGQIFPLNQQRAMKMIGKGREKQNVRSHRLDYPLHAQSEENNAMVLSRYILSRF